MVRNRNGQFAAGNPGGPGRPRRANDLRKLFLKSVSDDDLRAVVATLVAQAKTGDLAAIRELFNRVLGEPGAGLAVASEADEQMERLGLGLNHEPLSDLERRLGIGELES